MGLNNFQIALKGKQPSSRINSEDITEKQENSFCFRSWSMLISKTAIMMWFKYLAAQVRCPFCQPKEIWHLFAAIKLETAFLFGIYKRLIVQNLLWFTLWKSAGDLNQDFLLAVFWVLVMYDYFWGSAQHARVSWWLLQPAKAGEWGLLVTYHVEHSLVSRGHGLLCAALVCWMCGLSTFQAGRIHKPTAA